MGIFRRIMGLVRGFLSLFVGGIEKQAPKALLENEIQSFNQARATFNENLAKQGGLIHRLKTQIEEEKKKFAMLTTRVKTLMSSGQTDKAAQLAQQRADTKLLVAENETQLAEADALFRQLTRQRDTFVKQARGRIEKIKGKISKAEMAEAQAQLTEIASDAVFNPDGQGLASLEEGLDERISEAHGKTRVATEAIEGDAWVVSEEEQAALEHNALADFAAEMGMAAPPVDAEFEEVRYQLPAPSAENTIELGTPARAKVSVGE